MSNTKNEGFSRKENHEVLIDLSEQDASIVVGGAIFPNQKACTTGIALEALSGIGASAGVVRLERVTG